MAAVASEQPRPPREYVRTSLDAYETRMRTDLERSLRRKATALGFALVPLLAAPDG